MSDDEDWEDETILMVELNGIIDSNWANRCGNKCKFVGLDTANPLMQWDRYVFSGEYCDVLGTAVCFEKDPSLAGDNGPELKYSCHTFKKLSMVRAFLTEKEEHSDTEDETEENSQAMEEGTAEEVAGDRASAPSADPQPSTSREVTGNQAPASSAEPQPSTSREVTGNQAPASSAEPQPSTSREVTGDQAHTSSAEPQPSTSSAVTGNQAPASSAEPQPSASRVGTGDQAPAPPAEPQPSTSREVTGAQAHTSSAEPQPSTSRGPEPMLTDDTPGV